MNVWDIATLRKLPRLTLNDRIVKWKLKESTAIWQSVYAYHFAAVIGVSTFCRKNSQYTGKLEHYDLSRGEGKKEGSELDRCVEELAEETY